MRGYMVLVRYRQWNDEGQIEMTPSQGHGPFETREEAAFYLNDLHLPSPEYCLILPLTSPNY